MSGLMAFALLLAVSASCVNRGVVSYETVQSFHPAQGSIAMGYSAAALDEATRLSEVRHKCGKPIAEWEERIPYFKPTLKRLKYKTYDTHKK
jgi:hypothetical protein